MTEVERLDMADQNIRKHTQDIGKMQKEIDELKSKILELVIERDKIKKSK